MVGTGVVSVGERLETKEEVMITRWRVGVLRAEAKRVELDLTMGR